MVRNGELSAADLKRILRRYWWILPITTILMGALGFTATTVLPKKYTSSTRVLVEQPTVPSEYVKPVVTDDLNNRLASMKEQTLSRSRLQPIIEKFNLYPEDRLQAHMEDQVERLRKSIDVALMDPMPGSINRQPPGFYVNVTLSDPQLAQQICSEITSMFMEQNTKKRIQQASDTTQFLTGQLQESKAKLDEQDAKLAQFKRQYLGSLPEEQQSNLSLLAGMNSQLEAATQALSRAQQDKAFNESLLNQQEATWKAMQTGQQNPDTLEQQLTVLQDQLTSLLSKYTPQHPDVVKVKAQIEETKKRIEASPEVKSSNNSTLVSTRESPQMQQLRAKIKQDDLSIADLTRDQAQIQNQIRVLQGRVQASPMVEQQFKELTRNYQTALDIYNELLKKEQNSAMATSLEHQQESETFKVLDAPSLPLSPSFPKKLVFVGGGFGAGLLLALGILYLLAVLDKSLYTEHDVEVYLKMPVLTTVPSFEVAAQGTRGIVQR